MKGSPGGAGSFCQLPHASRFSRLYRGVLPPVLIEAPKRAIKFAANDQYSRLYMNLFNETKMTQPLSVLTGLSAGVTEAFLVVSFELIKIRMQDKNNADKYKNTRDVIVKVFRDCLLYTSPSPRD